MWEAFKEELRSLHLGAPPPEHSILARASSRFRGNTAIGTECGRRIAAQEGPLIARGIWV
jgi:hypothetical protein